jgi:prepilin-type N-terminal cleavage/methylation domain-containing protein
MRKANAGFTTMELLVVLAILGILAIIAVPTLMNELPRYRLKKAANELYANMQRARMGAIKDNHNWAIVFDTSVSPGRYFICSEDVDDDGWDGPAVMGGDDALVKAVNLSDYLSGVDFGHGTADDDIPGNGAVPADDITYGSDVLVFNSRGTGSAGYVYLENNRDDAYGVGTRSSGVILLREWRNGAWQ